MDAGLRLSKLRLALGGIGGAAIVAGLFLQWLSGAEIDARRDRVIELCGLALAGASGTWTADAVRRDLGEAWQWGRYDMPTRLLADRLPHDGDSFDAIRVTRHERLPGEGRRCRMSMCVYSLALDRAAATVSERRCGGGGVTEAVTPALKPDLLKGQ